ncbi:MAG TPA: carbohydrate ABC transporter permease [Geminicoccaceae bacterium]
MYPSPIQNAPATAQIAYRTALPLILGVWLLPLAAVMLTSVRPIEDLNRGNFWGWPSEISLVENYAAVFTTSPMALFLLNSFVVTFPAVAGAIALACMAGFALAKYRFRGNLLLFATFIGGNFVPFQVLMIPVRDLTISLHLYDTYWALIAFHVAFQTGFCTLVMRNFIKQLPDALIDAARLDGMSEFRILWHIVLPLVRPALAALAVLVFTFVWNDYFWALVLVQSDAVRPVTAGLQALRGMWLASWQLMSAGAIIAALPPVAIFFIMQQHFVAGLTLGTIRD